VSKIEHPPLFLLPSRRSRATKPAATPAVTEQQATSEHLEHLRKAAQEAREMRGTDVTDMSDEEFLRAAFG